MTYISVIVPFYNSEQHIAQCIEGLLSQEYPLENYEIIMVDNNSTDASAEIVRRYPRVKLVSEKKQGAYSARNRGLKEAKGEIIAFTDPDCVPFSEWLQTISTAMSHPDVVVVIGSHQVDVDSPFLSLLMAYENERNNFVFNSKIKELYFGHTNNMAVRERVFDKVGQFVERYRGADTIFVRRCIESYSCEAIRYLPAMRVRHMEIDSLARFYHKSLIYGRSRGSFRHIVHLRPLNVKERLLIFRRTIQSQKYSRAKSALLFILLIVGLVYWNLGGISAKWNSERETLS